MKINTRFILFTLVLVALTIACKALFGGNLDWSGFSPVIAIALFSGMIMKQKGNSFLLPLLALFLSDVVIHVLYLAGQFDYPGFYSGQWINYSLLMLTVFVGWAFKGTTYPRLLAGAFVGPTVYFLVSNFSVWLGAEGFYTKDFDGLMTCYTAALPFYRNGLLGTLVFLPVVLLLYNYMTRQKAVLTIA